MSCTQARVFMSVKKECGRCHQMLDYSCFHKSNGGEKTGLKCYCKKCCLAYKKALYDTTKTITFIDDLEGEIWKDVEGYTGKYRVSNYGRVMSCNRKSHHGNDLQDKLLKQVKTDLGYVIVGLYKEGVRKGRSVHRLVASMFIENPNKLPEVNHINGIKTDNRIENLEWCTRSENLKHCYKMGLRTYRGKQVIIS